MPTGCLACLVLHLGVIVTGFGGWKGVEHVNKGAKTQCSFFSSFIKNKMILYVWYKYIKSCYNKYNKIPA